jgi:ferritin-like metal-binding protein YciE
MCVAMSDFGSLFVGRLRTVLDIQAQIVATFPAIEMLGVEPRLARALKLMTVQSAHQTQRVSEMLELLYLKPFGQASWVTTALLREAWEAGSTCGDVATATQGCAAALLALKHYEMTEYEILLKWADQCALDEAIADLRRCFAEAVIQSAILAEFAFQESVSPAIKPSPVYQVALH